MHLTMVLAMRLFQVLSLFNVETTFTEAVNGERKTLFDFTTMKNVDNWMEIMDTTGLGKSKATLVLQKAKGFQRAVFCTLLNPLSNGAGQAGVRIPHSLNLSSFKNIKISCRGQGENSNYKIVLRHNGQHSNKDITYVQFFTVPMSSTTFSTISIPLLNFKASSRGLEVKGAEPLNTSNITMFGLQMFGGVYLPIKQKGVSALEIETIVATS